MLPCHSKVPMVTYGSEGTPKTQIQRFGAGPSGFKGPET